MTLPGRALLVSLALGLMAASRAHAGGTITWPPAPVPADANPSTIPTARLEWFQRFQQNLDGAKAAPAIDLLFDGDTLTEGWQSTGKDLWTERYAKLNAYNFAIAEDRTQNLLWRIENGELDNLHPKLIVLMIGTVNAGQPEQAADAIRTIVGEYRKRCPDAVLLLQGIAPRGALSTDAIRDKIKDINQTIAKLDDGKSVFFIDFGDKLLLPDGSANPELMTNAFFLTAKGYQVWADALQPLIDKYISAPGIPNH